MQVHRQRNRVVSSFLLWFIALLIASYVALFISVRFLILKPNAELIGDLLISLNDAVIELSRSDKTHLENLQNLYAERHTQTQILGSLPDPGNADDVWYPGIRALQNFIHTESQGTLTFRLIKKPHHVFQLFDSSHPDHTLQFTPSTPPFAKTFPIIAICVILFTCAIAAWLISRRLTMPLVTLAAQAKRLQTEKNAGAIVFDEKNTLPEIASLARSLNEMRSELDRTIRDRENLLAAVTHDLRTPLSRLQIALDILEGNHTGATPPLLEDVGEMRRILDQFVELGKLNEEVDEPWSEGDLNQFIRRIRDQYRRAGVNLRTQLPAKPVVIAYKPIGLTRLLYNLVDNACRHGDGNVQVTVSRDQDVVILTVSNKTLGVDQGTGLTQALAEQSGRLPTTGLGLKIARQFAEVHKAQLEESDADGIKFFSLRFNAKKS